MNNLKHVLPKPYEEYSEDAIIYDCINTGVDPVVGLAGCLEFETNAAEHSSVQRAEWETTHLDRAVEFGQNSYTSDGEIAYVKKDEYPKDWTPTGKSLWKDCISKS